MRLKIDQQKCIGCGICAEGCLAGLLSVKNCKSYVKEGCNLCGNCVNLCIVSAISIENDDAPAPSDKPAGSPKKSKG
jgi:ferredoxin